jgi:hypothetical protein
MYVTRKRLCEYDLDSLNEVFHFTHNCAIMLGYDNSLEVHQNRNLYEEKVLIVLTFGYTALRWLAGIVHFGCNGQYHHRSVMMKTQDLRISCAVAMVSEMPDPWVLVI